MEDNYINSVTVLFRENKWRDIIDKFYNYSERNKLLWVFPSESNLDFLKKTLAELKCDGIISVGCGSGLLEWIIMQATDVPVLGVEVDGAWWQSKYAPPTFIPLHFTANKLDENTRKLIQTSKAKALLFCYFNNRHAFVEYLRNFEGNVLIIIGPDGKGIHTDPQPFGDIGDDWVLNCFQEVRDSKDFIAIYTRICFK